MANPFSIDEDAEPQTLDEILEWHREIAEALNENLVRTRDAIHAGLPVSQRFELMAQREVETHFDDLLRELDRLAIFNLAASVEASIRVDYSRRVKERLKDPVSRAYRAWHKTLSSKKKVRPDFDRKGILLVLKEAQVMDHNIIGQYRRCLNIRHWVGHGRYWAKPADMDGLTLIDVHDRCEAILQALPA